MKGLSVLRPSKVQPEDLLDRLFKAWISHKLDELSEEDKNILERMEYAHGKIKEGGIGSMYKNLVDDMLEMFKDQQLTKRTIENDIARAKRFFASDYTREDKEYARGIHIEWLKRFIWKAEAEGDFRAVASLMKEKSEVEGLKTADLVLPDYTRLERQPILVITEATDLGVPEIENLEEELKILRAPKSKVKFEFDDAEEAEILPDNE